MIQRPPITLMLTLACVALGAGGCLEPFGGGKPTTPPKAAASRPAAGGRANAAKTDKKKKPKQTYAQAWQLICNAERLSGVDPKASRDVRSTAVADWINEHVNNKKARYWWIGYGKVKKANREQFFRLEAKEAGQGRCALTTLLFAKPKTPVSLAPGGKAPATTTRPAATKAPKPPAATKSPATKSPAAAK